MLELKEMIKATGVASGAVYHKKITKKEARVASSVEVVKTIINGVVETTNTASIGDYIVTGPAGEKYVMQASKFKKLYEKSEEGLYKTKPDSIRAVEVTEAITFKAPWGEKMIAETGDFIAYRNDEDAYRIEKSIFVQTYEKA